MPDTRSAPSRSRRSKGAPDSKAGSPTAASAPATPTTAADPKDDWQKKNPRIGKIGKASVAEKLVIRGNRNPNTRSKPMPLPNYGAIERRAK